MYEFLYDYPNLGVEGDRVIYANEAFYETTGFGPSEIIGKPLQEVWSSLLKITKSCYDFPQASEAFLFTKHRNVLQVKLYRLSHNNYSYLISLMPFECEILSKHFPFLVNMYSSSDFGVAIYSVPEYVLLNSNEQYLSANSFDRSSTIGLRVHDFVSNFSSCKVNEIWDEVCRTGKPFYDSEYHSVGDHQYNDTYWVFNVAPVTVCGNIKYIITTRRNLTETVQYKRTLQTQAATIAKQNEQLNSVVQNISDMVVIFDASGNIIQYNTAAKEFYNILKSYAPKEWTRLLKIRSLDGIALSDVDMPIPLVLAGKKVVNRTYMLDYKGHTLYYEVNATPINDETGKLILGMATFKDITQQINSIRTIQGQKDELEALMDNMSDAIFIFDYKDNYILKNKAAWELFPGIKRVGEGYASSTYLDMSGNPIPFSEMTVSYVKRGVCVRNRSLTLIQGDKIRYVSVSGTPIYDHNGNFRLGIISCRDISNAVITEKELRSSQDQLLKAEREKNEILENSLNMKDEFLSLVSHEFKTPLTVIYSAVQAIEYLYKDQLPGKAQDFIGNIKQNTYRQLRLVNNLLDVTRANSGHLKVHKNSIDIVFLTKSIMESVRLYADLRGINLSFISKITHKVIALDYEKYERIILNLLSNAMKYTPAGKAIVVTLSIAVDDNMICVDVADTGIGIPPDKQELIFERFGQVDSELSRQAEGSGIGLSLVKLFLDALGGYIELDSEVDRGSSFKVFLPAIQDCGQDEAAAAISDYNSRLIQSVAIEFSDIYL